MESGCAALTIHLAVSPLRTPNSPKKIFYMIGPTTSPPDITTQRSGRPEGEIRDGGNLVNEIRPRAVIQVLEVYLFSIHSSVLSNIHHPDVG